MFKDAPAFPTPPTYCESDHHGTNYTGACDGMNTRTYMATKILAGIMANSYLVQEFTSEHLVERAIRMTDKLIEALNE